MRRPGSEQEAKKGAWTDEEDRKLIYHIRTYGQGCWRTLPKAAGLSRCGKSCRLRWMNYLRPNIKRGKFDEDEEDLVIKLHALLGNRWSLIAGRLPGRTDNEVKNYWNSYLKRKLSALGIDPNNHRMSQTIHYSQNHNMSGSVGTSYDSINEEFNPIKTHAYPIDQTYNVTSLLEDNTSGSINLIPDLTYGSNSSFIGQSYISDCEIIEASESESDESRTLLLFT